MKPNDCFDFCQGIGHFLVSHRCDYNILVNKDESSFLEDKLRILSTEYVISYPEIMASEIDRFCDTYITCYYQRE